MKQILTGLLGPVFHPDGSITLLDVHEHLMIGERVSYAMPLAGDAGGFFSLGTGTIIGISGDTVTLDDIETREVPDIKEVPLPKHRYEPTHEEINKLAGELWLDNGGGWTSQDEADDNWYEAEGLLRVRHAG